MENFLFQFKKSRNQPLLKSRSLAHKHHKMVVQQNYKLNNHTSNLKTNKHHYHNWLSVSNGVVFLYSSFLVYIQQSTAVMLCTAAHVHPCRVREKGKRGREGSSGREVEEKTLLSQWETNDTLWEDKPYCSMLFFLQTTTWPNNTLCTNPRQHARPWLQ